MTSYRPQRASHRGANRGRERKKNNRAKMKEHKHRSGSKYFLEEKPEPMVETVVEETTRRIQSLGNQIFALSPFSQYHNEWLTNLRSVSYEFKKNPEIQLDQIFADESQRILTEIEVRLAERRKDESGYEDAAKKLAENNHSLIRINTDYATAMRELSSTKSSKIQDLTRQLHEFEKELQRNNHTKTSIFNPFSKRAKAQNIAETKHDIESVKKKIDAFTRDFGIEQEELHDEYEKKKEMVINEARELEKELESFETDYSLEDRRLACEALVSAVKELMSRKQA